MPITTMTASGTIWLSSYWSRSWEKLSAARLLFGFPPAPNQLTPRPGQIRKTVATSAQNVGRTVQIHAPAMPPNARLRVAAVVPAEHHDHLHPGHRLLPSRPIRCPPPLQALGY